MTKAFYFVWVLLEFVRVGGGDVVFLVSQWFCEPPFLDLLMISPVRTVNFEVSRKEHDIVGVIFKYQHGVCQAFCESFHTLSLK